MGGIFYFLVWISTFALLINHFMKITKPIPIQLINLDNSRSCTMTLIIISQNQSISQIPRYKLERCLITNTFLYTHSGAGRDLNNTFPYDIDNSVTDFKIVRVNGLDNGNLFALALSIYYSSEYVAVIDIDEAKKIELNVNSMVYESIDKLKSGCEIVFSNPVNPIAFISHQYVIRRFLLYTDVKYSEIQSMSLLYEMFACSGRQNYFVQQEEKVSPSCLHVPRAWNCDKEATINASYAVLIPTFKRNYLARSILSWEKQNLKPAQIIVVQNRMHTRFDFKSYENLTKIPIRHVWCTNWNSFFYLTYSVMMFIEEKYFIKIDDDHFLDSEETARSMHEYITHHPNTMVGSKKCGNKIAKKFDCGCTGIKRSFSTGNKADYISLLVMMYSSSGKILHRFRQPSYLYAEDVAIGLTNAIECKVSSVSIPNIKTTNVGSSDGLSHKNDREYKNVLKNFKDDVWRAVNCQYILYGYHPITWKNYKCPAKNKLNDDIRFRH